MFHLLLLSLEPPFYQEAELRDLFAFCGALNKPVVLKHTPTSSLEWHKVLQSLTHNYDNHHQTYFPPITFSQVVQRDSVTSLPTGFFPFPNRHTLIIPMPHPFDARRDCLDDFLYGDFSPTGSLYQWPWYQISLMRLQGLTE